MANGPQSYLTPREVQILRLVAAGQGSKQMAHDLGVSIKTIECHRGSLCDKLSAHCAATLAIRAVELGLVTIAVQPAVPIRNGKILRYVLPAGRHSDLPAAPKRGSGMNGALAAVTGG